MTKVRMKIDEIGTDVLKAKGFELSVGRVVEEWEETPGPNPMPDISTLREWDHKLQKSISPSISPSVTSAVYVQWVNVT